MVPLDVTTESTGMVGSNWLTNQPSVLASGWMFKVGERMRFPVSLHAALIWSCVARVPERRKRERGVAAAPLSTSEVADALASDTTFDTALRMSETRGGSSEVGAGPVVVRP